MGEKKRQVPRWDKNRVVVGGPGYFGDRRFASYTGTITGHRRGEEVKGERLMVRGRGGLVNVLRWDKGVQKDVPAGT